MKKGKGGKLSLALILSTFAFFVGLLACILSLSFLFSFHLGDLRMICTMYILFVFVSCNNSVNDSICFILDCVIKISQRVIFIFKTTLLNTMW